MGKGNSEIIIEIGRKVKERKITWEEASKEYEKITNKKINGESLRHRYRRLKDDYIVNYDSKTINADSETHFADGTISLEKQFLSEKDNLTEKDILKMYGYDINKWDIVSWTFNKWGQDGKLNYQFKCRLKPKTGLNIEDSVEIAKDLIKKEIKPFKIEKTNKKIDKLNDDLAILCNIVDLHIDRRCYEEATGEEYNIQKAEEYFYKIIEGLLKWQEIERVGHLFYTIGNDFFNYDNVNGTTSKGTQLVDANYREMYRKGLELQIKALKTFKQYFNKIHCFLVAGNHDEILDYTLYLHLKQMFSEDKNYIFDEDYKKVKSIMFGDNALFLSHGDIPVKKLANALPDMFPKIWGDSKYRYYFHGHFHSGIEDKKTMAGLKRIQQGSIIENDLYEYNNGFMNSIKEQELYEFEKTKGEIGTRIIR